MPPVPPGLVRHAPNQLAARRHQLLHPAYEPHGHAERAAFYPSDPGHTEGVSLFVLPADRSDELTAASERLVSGPADVMSGGVARRSGEAGAEQHNAPDWVLGRRPRRCLIELRGGQDRTTRPGLHRLRLHSRKQPLCTNKPLVETNPEPAN